MTLGGFITVFVAQGFKGGVDGGDESLELTDGNADELGRGNDVPDDS